ncbi:conserved hypothetical protein [Gammaproteobacteria bacterium]
MKAKVVHLGKIESEGRIIKMTDYGYGELATKPFKKGEVVLVSNFYAVPEDVSYYTFETAEGIFMEDNHELYVSQFGSRFRYNDQLVNHSCEPNMVSMGDTDFPTNPEIKEGTCTWVAIKDIKKGEQLTYDFDLHFWEISKYSFKCCCGSKNCRVYIQGFKFLPRDLQEKMISFAKKNVKEMYLESIKS